MVVFIIIIIILIIIFVVVVVVILFNSPTSTNVTNIGICQSQYDCANGYVCVADTLNHTGYCKAGLGHGCNNNGDCTSDLSCINHICSFPIDEHRVLPPAPQGIVNTSTTNNMNTRRRITWGKDQIIDPIKPIEQPIVNPMDIERNINDIPNIPEPYVHPLNNIPTTPLQNISTTPHGNIPITPPQNISTTPHGNIPITPLENIPTTPQGNTPTTPLKNIPTYLSNIQTTPSRNIPTTPLHNNRSYIQPTSIDMLSNIPNTPPRNISTTPINHPREYNTPIPSTPKPFSIIDIMNMASGNESPEDNNIHTSVGSHQKPLNFYNTANGNIQHQFDKFGYKPMNHRYHDQTLTPTTTVAPSIATPSIVTPSRDVRTQNSHIYGMPPQGINKNRSIYQIQSNNNMVIHSPETNSDGEYSDKGIDVLSGVTTRDHDEDISTPYEEQNGVFICHTNNDTVPHTGIIDVCSYSNGTIFLTKDHKIICEMLNDNEQKIKFEVSCNVKLSRVVPFNGYLYGVGEDKKLYNLPNNYFDSNSDTKIWEWNIVPWAPQNIDHISVTLDSLLLWLQSNGVGKLYKDPHDVMHSQKLSNNSIKRNYGKDDKHYVEINQTNFTGKKVSNNGEEHLNQVWDGVLDYYDKLYTITPMDRNKYRRINIVNWKPYYIQY